MEGSLNILCLNDDQVWGQQVCEQAIRLRWDVLCLNERIGIVETVGQYVPDLFLVGIDDFADLTWWETANLAGKAPVIFLTQQQSDEFIVKALNSGADGFLPKSPFSPRVGSKHLFAQFCVGRVSAVGVGLLAA
jgi:DNA-binding response OmpR family regulator